MTPIHKQIESKKGNKQIVAPTKSVISSCSKYQFRLVIIPKNKL